MTKQKTNYTTAILWGVYIALLLVLLPHTAWLFGAFEPATTWGTATAWAGALAFEAAIAVLTHKLSRRLENKPKRLTSIELWRYRYLNSYSAGLILAVAVSALANLAHAVQFGGELAIFTAWGIPPMIYQVAFGAVLPLVSLLFANVLSNETDSEETEDPVLVDLRKANGDLRKSLQAAERAKLEAEQTAQQQRDEFANAAAKFAGLWADEKRARILTARQNWPELPASAIAILTEASPAYVSEVLSAEQAEFVQHVKANGKAKVIA